MKSTPPDSFIFDLDGTLWDAAESCVLAWERTLPAFGFAGKVPDAAMIRSVSGMKIEEVLQLHYSFIPEEQRAAVLAVHKVHELECMRQYGGTLFSGVRETLKALAHAYPLFIVSNCLDGYIENFIQFHGFEGMFRDYESSGRTGLSKGENIRLVVERNGLQRPVYIGDTRWDQEAAAAAGVPFVYAAYGFGKAVNADQQIASFSELLKFILPDSI